MSARQENRQENSDQTISAFRFFLRAVGHHKFKTTAIFLAELLAATFTLLLPFIIKDVVDAVVLYQEQGGDFWDLVGAPFYHLVLVTIMMTIFSRMAGLTLVFLAPIIRPKPRAELVSHLQNHPVDFFQNRHGGALGNKVNESCNGLGNGLWEFSFHVWPILIQFLVSSVLILATNKMMALIMFIWALFYFFVMLLFAFRQAKHFEKISNARSKITGQVVDMATNIQAVKSYANEDMEKKNLKECMEYEKTSHFKFQFTRESAAFFHTLMSSTILISMIYVSLDLYQKNVISIGDIAFVFSLIILIVEQARGLIWSLTMFLEHIGQMRDGVNTIMRKHVLRDKQDAKTLTVQNPAVAIKNISFSYPDIENRPVMKGFSLEIPANQKLGIVGASGAGKSTLINLMMRFYDVQQGGIYIDGQNISDVTQKSLRQNIAIIPQDTSLFHRSLMDNIRYGRLDASDEEVIEASKKAYAHDFIKDLEKGYDTIVGERGLRLSGGQRQRIAIARAILKGAPILILDEATSALDSESEKLIQASLKTLMEGKTVLAIAHRLSTIAHLDRIVVMDEGEIIEDGTHDDLLSLNGHYKKLWSMQSGGFLKEKKQ